MAWAPPSRSGFREGLRREVCMKMNQDTWFSRTIAVAVASGLGIAIAMQDKAAPFGDDSSQFTVLLWLVTSGLLGFIMPRRPWLWTVSVGPWLPAMYLALQV